MMFTFCRTLINRLSRRVLLAVTLGLLSFAAGAKPLPPVSVSISSTQAPQAGHLFGFTVVVQPRVDLDHVELNVILPTGVSLLSGDIKQIVQVHVGTPIEMRYTVQLPATLAGVIVAQARAGSGADVLFSVSSRYELTTSKRKSQALAPQTFPPQRSWRNGEPVREYTIP